MKTKIKKILNNPVYAISILWSIVTLIATVPDFITGQRMILNWLISSCHSIYLIFLFFLSISLAFNVKQFRVIKSLAHRQAELENKQTELEKIFNHSVDILKNVIQFIRSICLDCIESPTRASQIDLFMAKLKENLPDGGQMFRIALAIPEKRGTFNIISSIGIEHIKINQLKRTANWKQNRSLFAHGMNFQGKKFEIVYNNDHSSNYIAKKPNEAYEESKSHLVIALKTDVYKEEKNFCQGCLAILTISSTEIKLLEKGSEEIHYSRLYPSIKGIESVLLQFHLIDAKLIKDNPQNMISIKKK